MRDILHEADIRQRQGADISVPVQRGDTTPYGLALTRELLTSLPAVVAYVSGPDLVVDFINDACSRLIGGRDVLGKPLGEAMPELHDEVEVLNRVMATGEPVRGSEARLRLNRGGPAEQHLFLDYVYQPVPGAGGNMAGISVHSRTTGGPTPHA